MNRLSRVLIGAGGTGGHIFPGIAVAREFQRRDPHVEVVFVGTARGLETRVVPAEGFELELIDIAGLKRVGVLNTIRTLLMLPRSFVQARRIIKRFRPDIVIGVGGYASGPVLLAAALMGLPTMVIEPNALPGFTNRVLARVVRAAAVAFAEAAPYFGGKAVVTGNPVRPEFFAIPPKPGQEQGSRAAEEQGGEGAGEQAGIGSPPSAIRHPPSAILRPFHLLIFGGSQGAHAINVAVTSALPALLVKHTQLTALHQTGERDFESARAAYQQQHLTDRIEALPFIHHMARELARADLILSRAGATTVAELTAAGKPAILVPLPTAADDHQRKNAAALEHQGAARCIIQSELTPERLAEEISRLIENPSTLAAMSEASRRLAHADAAQKIVDLAYSIARLKTQDSRLKTGQETKSWVLGLGSWVL
jgi:UDP-N-acetylglucosamine--N-acetylmuramyl-(pentapeptide) pyrophosphoryl-undecaprenol N-acetylglucosamine transferase